MQEESDKAVTDKEQVNEAAEYEETLAYLRDFLQYPEDKKIINSKYLSSNKEEMSALIADLLKLDLKKFNNYSNSNRAGEMQLGRQSPGLRKGSPDPIPIGSPNNNCSNNRYHNNLPIGSPNNNNNNSNRSNIICYFSPVSVTGNGNIVTTGVPPSQLFSQPQKKPLCSQKLFEEYE